MYFRQVTQRGRSPVLTADWQRRRSAFRIQQHQQFEFALGRAAADKGEAEALLAADPVAVALLQGDDRPADIGEDFPEPYPLRVEPPPRLGLIAPVKINTIGNAADLAVEPGEAPTLAAQPTDILIGVAPTGEFPVEDAGQFGAIQHVIAGAEIAMAQHRLADRPRNMRL